MWKVGVWGALAATTSAGSAGSAGSGGEFQIVQKTYVFTAKVTRVTLRCNVFLTFSYPSHLKHLVLIAFLKDCLPEMLSKLGVLAERGIKKSKKHHAIAPIAKTPRKVPGREHIDCENTMNMKLPIGKVNFTVFFLLVFVIEFSFSLCFTMIFEAFLLKRCSKTAPAALGGCGGLWVSSGRLWRSSGRPWRAL